MQVIDAQKKLKALETKYRGEEELILDSLPKEERVRLGYPIKNINTLDSFNANGTRYIVRKSLTLERFEEFEALHVKVGWGLGLRDLFKNLRTAYDYLNKPAPQPMDAGVILYNCMNGISENIEKRENPVLRLCALFMVTEDEDLTTIDEDLIQRKIKDWTLEGISANSFFTLAFNLVNNFMPVYNQVSATTSEHLKRVKEEVNRKTGQSDQNTLTEK